MSARPRRGVWAEPRVGSVQRLKLSQCAARRASLKATSGAMPARPRLFRGPLQLARCNGITRHESALRVASAAHLCAAVRRSEAARGRRYYLIHVTKVGKPRQHWASGLFALQPRRAHDAPTSTTKEQP